MDVTYLFVRNLINNFNYWYWTVVVIVGHTITRYKIAEMARNTVRCFQFLDKKKNLDNMYDKPILLCIWPTLCSAHENSEDLNWS